MAGGDFILDASGNRALRAGGVFDTCEECCCGEDCTHCGDCTPKTLTLVTSGISFNEDCCIVRFPGEARNDAIKWLDLPSVSPNGTFVLPQQATPCWWLLIIESTGEIGVYDNDDCTSQLGSLDVEEMRVFIVRTALKWCVDIVYAVTGMSYPYNFFPNPFYASIVTDDCETGGVESNTVSSCGVGTSGFDCLGSPPTRIFLADGGSGTLTP